MLIDTHVLIWMLMAPARLGRRTRQLLRAAEDVRASVLSLYEMALKERLGKFSDFGLLESEAKVQAIEFVPISSGQMRKLAQLTGIRHMDPFDLGIVSLAIDRHLPLITADKTLLDLHIDGLELIDARK